MKLTPRDLIADRRQQQRGILSPTLRYLNSLSSNNKRSNNAAMASSLQSTLTSDEEASKTESIDENIPEFPTMNEHGIYEILNADQQNAWL